MQELKTGRKRVIFSEILNSWNGFNQMACYLSQNILAYSSATQSFAEFNAKQSRQKYAYSRKQTILGKNMRTPCNKCFDSSDFLNLLTSSLKLLYGNTWWMALANLVFAQQVNTQNHFKSVKRFILTLLPGGKNLFIPFLVTEEEETQDTELHFWEYNEKFLTKVALVLFCMWLSTVGLL